MTTRLIEFPTHLSQEAIPDFLRAEYPIHIQANIEFTQIKDACAWCVEEFGPSARVVHRPPMLYTANQWANFSRHYFFKDPDLAVMFKMVWG